MGQCLRIGEYTLECSEHVLRGPKGQAIVSPLAVRMLSILSQAAPEPVGRSELIDSLWQGNALIGEPALNRLVSETRSAAKTAGSEPLIRTISRVGYALAGSAEQIAHPAVTHPSHSRALPARKVVLAIMAILAVVFLANSWFENRVAEAYLTNR